MTKTEAKPAIAGVNESVRVNIAGRAPTLCHGEGRHPVKLLNGDVIRSADTDLRVGKSSWPERLLADPPPPLQEAVGYIRPQMWLADRYVAQAAGSRTSPFSPISCATPNMSSIRALASSRRPFVTSSEWLATKRSGATHGTTPRSTAAGDASKPNSTGPWLLPRPHPSGRGQVERRDRKAPP
jgi:hypothetical protein